MKCAIRETIETPSEFPLEDGRRLKIGPGEIVGELSLKNFINEELFYGPTCGLTELNFLFKDASGAPYKHSSILNWGSFFPRPVHVCERIDKLAQRSLIIATESDSDEPYTINFDDGSSVVGKFKCVNPVFHIDTLPEHMVVDFEVYNMEIADYIRGRFNHSYQSILWRKASPIVMDEIMIEAESYIDVSTCNSEIDLPVNTAVVISKNS